MLELAGIGSHPTQPRRRNERQLDVLADQTPQHVHHPSHDGVQVEHRGLEDLFPAEGEQLVDQAGRPVARRPDQLNVAPERIIL